MKAKKFMILPYEKMAKYPQYKENIENVMRILKEDYEVYGPSKCLGKGVAYLIKAHRWTQDDICEMHQSFLNGHRRDYSVNIQRVVDFVHDRAYNMTEEQLAKRETEHPGLWTRIKTAIKRIKSAVKK